MRTEGGKLIKYLRSIGGGCVRSYTNNRKTYYRIKLWHVTGPRICPACKQPIGNKKDFPYKKKKLLEKYAMKLGALTTQWNRTTVYLHSESFIATFPLKKK